MECKGERAQRRLDELLSEIDDWATEAFWTGFYSGCEHEHELKDEINWLHAALHGAELETKKLRELVKSMYYDLTNMTFPPDWVTDYEADMRELGVEV